MGGRRGTVVGLVLLGALVAACGASAVSVELRPGVSTEIAEGVSVSAEAGGIITAEVAEPPGDVVAAFSSPVSSHLLVEASEAGPAELRFEIPEGASEDLLVGIRWSDEGWEPLPTTVSDGTAIVATPGFSSVQLVELEPAGIEAAMRQRLLDHLDLAAIAARDHVATCDGAEQYEIEVRVADPAAAVGYCQASADDDGSLRVELINGLNAGVFLRGGDGAVFVERSRKSAAELLSEVLEPGGALLVPAGGSVVYTVDAGTPLPIVWSSSIDSTSVTFDVLSLGLGMRAGLALDVAGCVDGLVSEQLAPGSADRDHVVACVQATFPEISQGAASALAEGIVSGVVDGTVARVGEVATAAFGSTGEATVVLRQSPTNTQPVVGLADKRFTYVVDGFRLEATLHLGEVAFPITHDCASTGLIAPPGYTWITVPITIRNLQTDRPAPAIQPNIALATAGGDVLAFLNARQDFFSGGNCLMRGDFQDGALGPSGSAAGTLVVSGPVFSSDAPIPEDYDPTDFIIAVQRTGLGVSYQLEDPLTGPWDLTGVVRSELQD